MIPEGLWMTFMTTPPFPAPSSPSFSKSFSWVSSPTCCFWVRNVSSRSLCCSLMSSSFTFCCKSCRSMPLISLLGFLYEKKMENAISHPEEKILFLSYMGNVTQCIFSLVDTLFYTSRNTLHHITFINFCIIIAYMIIQCITIITAITWSNEMLVIITI